MARSLLVAATLAVVAITTSIVVVQAGRMPASKVTAGGITSDGLPADIQPSSIVEHHSFYPPLLEEYWNGGLQHFDFGLSTAVTNSYVRLTPAKQSREGYFWNDNPSHLTAWTIEVGFRAHAPAAMGADGFAIWYAETPVGTGGPLFGLPERGFRGLGVIFDTFDNDGRRDNPSVHVVLGDGTEVLRGDNDFADQRLGGCVFNFRNTDPNDVVRATIAYRDERVSVSLRSRSQAVQCATITPLTLPDGYYFGATAHTGHLADNHDIHYFLVTAPEREQKAEVAANDAAEERKEEAKRTFSHADERKEQKDFTGKNSEAEHVQQATEHAAAVPNA